MRLSGEWRKTPGHLHKHFTRNRVIAALELHGALPYTSPWECHEALKVGGREAWSNEAL